MSDHRPKRLIIFGDFSCPFSALASHRAAALEANARAEIEWRGIQHLPDQPLAGVVVEAGLATKYEREVEQIRSLLMPTEDFPLKVPSVQPNTGLAIAAFAAAAPDDRALVRQRVFEAFWFEGADIGAPGVLAGLGAPPPDQPPPAAAEWQAQWESFDKRMVPMLVMPDGYLSRGLGALSRLAALAEGV
ncbi:MAG: DsbA family protein [Acidimicrobiia bacterium]